MAPVLLRGRYQICIRLGKRLVHHGVREAQILFFRPGLNLLPLFLTHGVGLCCGAGLQAVVADRVVENGDQLIVDS